MRRTTFVLEFILQSSMSFHTITGWIKIKLLHNNLLFPFFHRITTHRVNLIHFHFIFFMIICSDKSCLSYVFCKLFNLWWTQPFNLLSDSFSVNANYWFLFIFLHRTEVWMKILLFFNFCCFFDEVLNDETSSFSVKRIYVNSSTLKMMSGNAIKNHQILSYEILRSITKSLFERLFFVLI